MLDLTSLSWQEQALSEINGVVSVFAKIQDGKRVLVVMFHGSVESINAAVENNLPDINVVFEKLPGDGEKQTAFTHLYGMHHNNVASHKNHNYSNKRTAGPTYNKAVSNEHARTMRLRNEPLVVHKIKSTKHLIRIYKGGGRAKTNCMSAVHTILSDRACAITIIATCLLFALVALTSLVCHAAEIRFALISISAKGTVVGAEHPRIDRTTNGSLLQKVYITFNAGENRYSFIEEVAILQNDPLELASDAMPLHPTDCVSIAYLERDPAGSARLLYPIRFFVAVCCFAALIVLSFSAIYYILRFTSQRKTQ